jgi:hypothetical protein
MVYVPTPPPPSRRSKELAAAIVRLAGEYQAREGRLKPLEIQTALRLAGRELLSRAGGGLSRRQRLLLMLLILGIALTLGLLIFLTNSR